jgi:hypothetical protein
MSAAPVSGLMDGKQKLLAGAEHQYGDGYVGNYDVDLITLGTYDFRSM